MTGAIRPRQLILLLLIGLAACLSTANVTSVSVGVALPGPWGSDAVVEGPVVVGFPW